MSAPPAAMAEDVRDMALPNAEIDWERLDKTKFFLWGAGLFSGLSCCLYPLTVVKTRVQVQDRASATAYKSMADAYRQIFRHEGIRGFYKGFGTTILGSLPARMVYMSTLERTKSFVASETRRLGIPESTAAGITSGVAGLTASVVTQTVVVPVDVVTQRLMVQRGQAGVGVAVANLGGGAMIRQIVAQEGLRGLYRGFGMSIITYGPSSGVWWATYGASQRAIWRNLGYRANSDRPSQTQIVGVQIASGLCAGAVGALVTTPLDTVKTRLQVLRSETGARPTLASTLRTLVAEDGFKGFYRGLGPRWASMSLWGTCMVTTYEFLKRLSAKPL